MADDIDKQDEKDAVLKDASIANIREAAANIPRGYPGECEICEEEFERIVNGLCARCRDKYNLP